MCWLILCRRSFENITENIRKNEDFLPKFIKKDLDNIIDAFWYIINIKIASMNYLKVDNDNYNLKMYIWNSQENLINIYSKCKLFLIRIFLYENQKYKD